MSRRVFDVGLDMGRIRNGLKPNRENKRSKSYRSTKSVKDDTRTDDTPVPSGNNALVPVMKHKKSSPTIGAQRDEGHDPAHDILVLPSNNPDSDFPLPPSNRATPDEHVNGNGERTLHSSQLYQNNGSPTHTPKTDEFRRHSDGQNFDLKPPPPNTKVKNVDTLSEQLFSGDHLRVILKDPSFFLRFTAFLNRYKPHSAPILVRYLEAQKATKAVEYANALAETIKPSPGEHASPCPAASIDPRFEARLKRSFDSLVNDALPAYITNSLTKVVTESMVREITGTGMPVMRELVGGLAEVFCLADPSIKECPIVYASEEFYRTTRYSRDDVLGKNCRFLQGPKTNRTAIARLSAAIKNGQEICETVLNYRRDGSPFMNLLLIAPLYDNRGAVRYFIGAQIDVSGLIEDGRGLDSFERFLAESRPNRNRDSDVSDDGFTQKHLRTLNEFGQLLSLDESSVFARHSRDSSMADNASSVNYSSRGAHARGEPSLRRTRRVLGNDDDLDEKDRNTWALSSAGPSGKLPGVYQNVRPPHHHTTTYQTPTSHPQFSPRTPLHSCISPTLPPTLLTENACEQYLLVRPHPSLRIIFVSPALRIPGLLQSPFLSRIGGPQHVREGLADAFEAGAAVTAKVTWLPQGHVGEDGSEGGDSRPGSRKGGPGSTEGARTRYISCTPLLGSDDQVGVWMVVMVENELVTGSLASRNAALARYNNEVPPQMPRTPSEYQYQRESTSLDSESGNGSAAGQRFERSMSGHVRGGGGGGDRGRKVGSEGGRLYAEFMRNGGGGGGVSGGGVTPLQGKGGAEWQGDYLSNGNGSASGDAGVVSGEGRFEEVRSP